MGNFHTYAHTCPRGHGKRRRRRRGVTIKRAARSGEACKSDRCADLSIGSIVCKERARVDHRARVSPVDSAATLERGFIFIEGESHADDTIDADLMIVTRN